METSTISSQALKSTCLYLTVISCKTPNARMCLMSCVLSVHLCTGERLFGKGERADVRAGNHGKIKEEQ